MDEPIKDEVGLSKTDFLKNQLSKEPGDSKKWRMAKNGLWGVGVFFGVGTAAVMFLPAVAAQVVLLVQTAIGAWTAICGVYLGAQGSVDFKTTQALSASVEKKDNSYTENKTEHIVKEEHVYHEGEPGSPVLKPWGQHATEDHEEEQTHES